MDESSKDKWIAFLDPKNLKGNLISCALLIAMYESSKENTISQVKSLFHIGFKDGVDLYSENYKEVLAKDKSPFKATLLWLKEHEAISEEDISSMDSIRKYRNQLAHEMMNLLFEGLDSDYLSHFELLLSIRIKIERWWILNIEIPTNPDYDGKEITEDDITTSTQITYRLILDMLSDDEKTANYYREHLLNHFK